MQDRIIIHFDVDSLEIKNRGNRSVKSGNRNYVLARFHFTPNWNDLTKQIILSKTGVDTVQDIIINDTYRIPNEFMIDSGQIVVSIFGGDRLTTNTAIINVEQSGYKPGAPPLPTEPTYGYVTTPNNTVMQITREGGVFYGLYQGRWVAFDASGGSEPPSASLEIDEKTLKFVGNVLSVNTTDNMITNNVQPITSHGVSLQVGNINALLEQI